MWVLLVSLLIGSVFHNLSSVRAKGSEYKHLNIIFRLKLGICPFLSLPWRKREFDFPLNPDSGGVHQGGEVK